VNDWAPLVLKAVVPFAAAGLAALLTPVLVPTRGLRRELSVDVGLLDKLPAGPVRTELSADVESRAVKLLHDHVSHGVADALSSGDPKEAAAKSKELMEAVQRFARTR